MVDSLIEFGYLSDELDVDISCSVTNKATIAESFVTSQKVRAEVPAQGVRAEGSHVRGF